jgi:hypothetical protein
MLNVAIVRCSLHCIALYLSSLQTFSRVPYCHIYIYIYTYPAGTCPSCRYELPTSDADYEQGRVQRMQLRKPRFARHELDRLSIKECKALLRQRQLAKGKNTIPTFCDKSNLIDYLITSGAIDLIVAPAPVQWRLSALQAMSIGQLKRCMNDQAGVFYNPKDVIEKSDMVRIFLNSGRLDVLPELIVEVDVDVDVEPDVNVCNDNDNDDDDVYSTTADDVVNDNKSTTPMKNKKNGKPAPAAKVDRSSAATRVPLVETVSEDSDDEGAPDDDPTVVGVGNANNIDARVDTTILMEENTDFSEQEQQQQESARNDTTEASDDRGVEVTLDASIADPTATEPTTANVATANVAATATQQDTPEATSTSEAGGDVEEVRRKRARVVAEEEAASASTETQHLDNDADADDEEEQEDPALRDRFDGLSIAALRRLAREASVDLSGCIERKEMIDRLTSSSSSHGSSGHGNGDASGTAAAAASDNSITRGSTSFEEWSDWGVSEIFALAALVDVDLSQCANRDEMIHVLHDESLVRPHVARYLNALVPLARLTVPQLRAVAREWRVDISDCLEKGDIFHRLVCAGGPPGGGN